MKAKSEMKPRAVTTLLLASFLASASYTPFANADSFFPGTSGGAQGPQGPAGDQGPPGSSGAQGEQGVPGTTANQMLGSCVPVLRAGTLIYDVQACSAIIAGVTYGTAATTVTLDTADGSNPRFDLIVAREAGGTATVTKITGTPAATPITPDVDSSTEVQIAIARIDAAATTPTGVTTEVIYDENNDWTFAGSDGSNVGNSTAQPHGGTTNIEGTTVAANDYFRLTEAAPLSLSAYNTLSCWIRPKVAWGAGLLELQWYSGASTKVGSVVSIRAADTFEFDSSVLSYQLVTIPLYAFGSQVSSTNVDRIEFKKRGSGTIGYYVDDCTLQGGVQQTIFGSAAMVFRGAWSATPNYVPNDVVTSGGLTYVARESNTDDEPSANPLRWTSIGGGGGATDARFWIGFATCQNTVAFLAIDQPTANFPSVACITGTNTQKAVADFDGAADESLQTSFRLPVGFNGTVDVNWKWLTTATTGSAGFCVQLVCVADAETDDPAFPAQGAGNCVSDAAKGTTNQTNDATDLAITATGCAADEIMHARFSRDADGSAVTDDMSANDARALGVEMTLGITP